MRGSRVLITVIVLVAGIYLLRPTIDRLLFAETQPRTVEVRGNLPDFEKLTIDIFQRAAPSVVQVAGRTAVAGPEIFAEQDEGRDKVVPDSCGTAPATSSPTITWCRAQPNLRSAFQTARSRVRNWSAVLLTTTLRSSV